MPMGFTQVHDSIARVTALKEGHGLETSLKVMTSIRCQSLLCGD